MCGSGMASLAQNTLDTTRTHLHTVVLVIYVLQPRDELSGIEAIPYRLVLITL